MVDTLELEKQIEASGKSKTHLACRCGVTIQTLKNKSENRTEFTLSEVNTLCDELNIKSLVQKERIFFAKK